MCWVASQWSANSLSYLPFIGSPLFLVGQPSFREIFLPLDIGLRSVACHIHTMLDDNAIQDNENPLLELPNTREEKHNLLSDKSVDMSLKASVSWEVAVLQEKGIKTAHGEKLRDAEATDGYPMGSSVTSEIYGSFRPSFFFFDFLGPHHVIWKFPG